MKRGYRVVHSDEGSGGTSGDTLGGKVLVEKLGRRDLCPCGSGRRFQAVLSRRR